MNTILSELFKYQDIKYKEFTSPLLPTVPSDSIIGIRTPQLRKIAKSIFGSNDAEIFLSSLPHAYYEENSLHAFLIEQIKDYNECINALNLFLPYVNNWATCDCMNPKCFRQNAEPLLGEVKNWLKSPHAYTVRYGIKTLMSHYLDDNFCKEYLDLVAGIYSDEYYINMMIAWFFATALAKQWDTAAEYITQKKLPAWVHNKTIQKSVESRRITPEQKEFLKSYKIK